MAKGELVNPASVERCLRSKFGDALDAVRAGTERLAACATPEQLDRDGFRLDEQFRPEVPPDERDWGAKGVLDVARIRALGTR
jgi:hypothetical protein